MDAPRKSTCATCGAAIYLIETGVDNRKWATKPGKPLESWKCRPTRDFPVRSHTPKEDPK